MFDLGAGDLPRSQVPIDEQVQHVRGLKDSITSRLTVLLIPHKSPGRSPSCHSRSSRTFRVAGSQRGVEHHMFDELC